MPRFTRTARAIAALPAAGLTLTLLAACGGGAATDTAAGNDAQQTSANGGTGAPGGQNGTQTRGARQLPGASGKIAEISGSTMQVQNISTQTAVSWTKDTTFTDTVSAESSDLAVGDCIAVTPASTDTTVTTDETTPVAAASISINDAVNGACAIGGFGGPGGGGGFRGQMPEAQASVDGQAPTTRQLPDGAQRPDGAQGNRIGGFRGGVSGKVVSVDGGTITVEMTRPAMPNGTSTAPPTTGTTTTSRTVTFSSTTTWNRTESAGSDALKVGRCVTALGTAGSTGAVTATSIVVRPATDGECTGGLMSRGQGAPANTTAGA